MNIAELLPELSKGFLNLTWGNIVMIAAALVLIYLAVFKEIEPVLLLPIGFGCLLANIPLGGMTAVEGMMGVLYDAGIRTELFPLLIFVGVGAMIDFSPLLSQPKMALLGAAGQFGIYGTLILAILIGFPLNQAASIGIIGAIDGPTSIFVATKLAPELLAPIAVAAYSYMSLIPIIQPPIMKALTTKKERMIRMEYAPKPVSQKAILLISMLMLGNLLKVCGVVDRLSKSAQNEIINVATLFLGLAIGATMEAGGFLSTVTLKIMGLGLIAFMLDTVAGLLFGKLMAVMSGYKINPLIGASGISAFPMAGRIAAKMASEEDPDNYILMHAMGANTAGQLGSVIAGGILLAIVLNLV
jgi:Na+-transporting methylmalonyl-CoA/oxaloacetate decarboxylase beta subunit